MWRAASPRRSISQSRQRRLLRLSGRSRLLRNLLRRSDELNAARGWIACSARAGPAKSRTTAPCALLNPRYANASHLQAQSAARSEGGTLWPCARNPSPTRPPRSPPSLSLHGGESRTAHHPVNAPRATKASDDSSPHNTSALFPNNASVANWGSAASAPAAMRGSALMCMTELSEDVSRGWTPRRGAIRCPNCGRSSHWSQ